MPQIRTSIAQKYSARAAALAVSLAALTFLGCRAVGSSADDGSGKPKDGELKITGDAVIGKTLTLGHL